MAQPSSNSARDESTSCESFNVMLPSSMPTPASSMTRAILVSSPDAAEANDTVSAFAIDDSRASNSSPWRVVESAMPSFVAEPCADMDELHTSAAAEGQLRWGLAGLRRMGALGDGSGASSGPDVATDAEDNSAAFINNTLGSHQGTNTGTFWFR